MALERASCRGTIRRDRHAFLKIPVQPRWDGPQDLFGFYNYIEKRYKATDLARALIHLDPNNWPDQAKRFQDRMLLVLLDEMNLARVEYYLLGIPEPPRRSLDEVVASDRDRRTRRLISMCRGAGRRERVYVGQNVLFVGTMNEDESTLSLSDKVIDRANVMRFPKPVELKERPPRPDSANVAEGYLPKKQWLRSWMRDAERLDGGQHSRAIDIITSLNGTMDELGRPFGHYRMAQAMLH